MIFDQAIVDWIPVNYKDSWRLHDTLTGFFSVVQILKIMKRFILVFTKTCKQLTNMKPLVNRWISYF
jgi:hypothetical protein